jgi:transposase InsO family protein
MKELGITSVIRKKVYKHKFKPAEVAGNILARSFTADKPLQKLCMDITYIPIDRCSRRFLYMNAVKDLYNGEIIAYDLSLRNDTKLVASTLKKLLEMELSNGCILHTDQGFQYTRKEYCKQLRDANIIQSMSRRGNCWDNVPIENFFGHFKSELIYLIKSTDVTELVESIHQYIHFYNNERIQLKSGMSPVEYRTHAA